MEMAVAQLANGIMLGAVYALVALGFTLIYAVLKVLQFSHGEVVMLSAYIVWATMRVTHNNLAVSIIAGLAAAVIVSILMERFAFRIMRERGSGEFEPFIVAIGLGMLITELSGLFFYHGVPVGFPQAIRTSSPIKIGPINLTLGQLLTLIVGLLVMFLLYQLLYHTKQGKSLRAVAINWQIANLLGIPVNRVASLTFALGGVLAAVAALLFAMNFGFMAPWVGGSLAFKGLAVVLFAGLGSVVGAVVCGLFLGVAEAIAVGYLASSWRDAIAFTGIIVILMFRPGGVFGTRY